jgi:hypothetical protein
MDIVPENELPEWLKYPREYLRLVEYDFVKFPPWYLLDSRFARARYEGLRQRYPDRKLFAFAARRDNDDIACWEEGDASNVRVIHDFGDTSHADRLVYRRFWDWFQAAIQDMVVFFAIEDRPERLGIPMFTQLAFQKVRHRDGYVVQIANRESVEYIEAGRRATIFADFSRMVILHIRTLDGWFTDDGTVPMSPSDRIRATQGIIAGLEAMGSNPVVELC